MTYTEIRQVVHTQQGDEVERFEITFAFEGDQATVVVEREPTPGTIVMVECHELLPSSTMDPGVCEEQAEHFVREHGDAFWT